MTIGLRWSTLQVDTAGAKTVGAFKPQLQQTQPPALDTRTTPAPRPVISNASWCQTGTASTIQIHEFCSESFMSTQTLDQDRSRITARIPARVQQTLETAASMVGATVNQFIVQSALREAERIIEQDRVIHLSAQDGQRFLAALDNPPPLSGKLKAALRNHAKLRTDHGSNSTFIWSPQPKRV